MKVMIDLWLFILFIIAFTFMALTSIYLISEINKEKKKISQKYCKKQNSKGIEDISFMGFLINQKVMYKNKIGTIKDITFYADGKSPYQVFYSVEVDGEIIKNVTRFEMRRI